MVVSNPPYIPDEAVPRDTEVHLYDPALALYGGPDGLDPRILDGADESIRLSSLTLPHALVRVVLAEALYRAVSVTKGHPYHRD